MIFAYLAALSRWRIVNDVEDDGRQAGFAQQREPKPAVLAAAEHHEQLFGHLQLQMLSSSRHRNTKHMTITTNKQTVNVTHQLYCLLHTCYVALTTPHVYLVLFCLF